MEVLSGSGEEVFIQVFIGGWSTGELLLHDRHKFLLDLIHLITGKQVGYLQCTE